VGVGGSGATAGVALRWPEVANGDGSGAGSVVGPRPADRAVRQLESRARRGGV